jgi:hypothetical protein
MKPALRLFFLVLLGFSMATCQKDFQPIPGGPTDPVGINITATVAGRIIDEQGRPVQGAMVTAGSSNAMTDVNGMFQIKDATLKNKAALVKVSKIGYFGGSRTFMARQGQKHYVEIELLPMTVVGNIDANAGGTINVGNGSAITLPANGVVVDGSGSAYSGNVSVAMAWINPTSANLYTQMPGDLRGIDAAGRENTLQSFGMLGVELYGAAGQKLQIASGKKATLKFPLPTSIQAAAPSTIPLWSFDESTGLWKEEGTATKSGGVYVGDVSHFSFWNCDAAFLNVIFSATFKDQSGQPLVHRLIKLTRSGPTNGIILTTYGFTDSTGYVSGRIPQNETLLMEVLGSYQCAQAIFSQNIGPYAPSSNANLGIVTVNTGAASGFTVTGTAQNCSGSPVTNGFADVKVGWQTYRSPIVAGAFSVNFAGCGATQAITYSVVDITAGQQSAPVAVTVNAGTNAVGVVTACGTSTQQYITYVLDGVTYNLASPADSMMAYRVQQGTTAPYTVVNGGNGSSSINFDFNGAAIGSFLLDGINVWAPTAMDSISVSTSNPIMVNVTEYGPPSGFITGSFGGTLMGSSTPTHTIQCTFRVRRQN